MSDEKKSLYEKLQEGHKEYNKEDFTLEKMRAAISELFYKRPVIYTSEEGIEEIEKAMKEDFENYIKDGKKD
jgi:hypothetical protein